ncbi:N-acetyltransferase [uncultured Methanolobus sp.]|uniref:N-acetyltransferase n=1 Tax=uncultured Methanolobus sp. TaxID=218300 RepID=UPI002AABD160|nr:N-acetyltransferase [uncultured Methanolobus sp.]
MIKEFENSEIDSIMDIWLKTTIDAHYFIPEYYWTERYNVVKEEYLPGSTTFVYKEHGTVKGFISVLDNSFIGALFVLEAQQRKGIGRKLLDYCKSFYPEMELAVYADNKPAIDFYTKNGFVIKKEQNNEDSGFVEYIMYFNAMQE